MEDNRRVGMYVWLIPPYGKKPTPMKVTKVTSVGVTCDDGYRYNLRVGDTSAKRWGSGIGANAISTECQKNRVENFEAEQVRNALMLRYRTQVNRPLSNEQLKKAIAFFAEIHSQGETP